MSGTIKEVKTGAFGKTSGRLGSSARLERAGMHQRVADKLRQSIVRGHLGPGERIGEVEMCSALNVSRTPLREALKQLASEGLVELRSNRGAIVAPLRHDELDELFEVVAALEGMAAKRAAARLRKSDLRRMENMHNRMERFYEERNLKEYFKCNQKIHYSWVASGGNSVLTRTHSWLMGRVERARYIALHYDNRWSESIEEHRVIMDSLISGNGNQVEESVREHVLRTGRLVCERLKKVAGR
jgi:DNA-binding GntR family transcriptional regulator